MITWWVCVTLRQEEEGSEEAVKNNIDILSYSLPLGEAGNEHHSSP